MKFTWLSNAPWCATGYGNQTKIFVPRLVEMGHEAAIIAFYGHEGTPIFWSDPNITKRQIWVYGKGLDPYAQDVMGAHTVNFGAPVMISLIDAWVIKPDAIPSTVSWVPWFPVDMEPIPPPVMDHAAKAYRRLVFSRFAERMVHDAGHDCDYIPHGIDTTIFSPKDKKSARELLSWPQDKFIVGMVAANKGSHLHTPSRKSFVQHLQAFALLNKKYPDTMLYMHTCDGARGEHNGIDLRAIIKYLEIEDAVEFVVPYSYLLGLPDNLMTNIYNGMDVHMLASMGEGFGIPTVEAQACGTPVIVGDWCASEELCFSGWSIPKEEAFKYWIPNLNSNQWIVYPEALFERLEQAYLNKDSRKLRKRARKGAMAYDANLVARKYWKPLMTEIANLFDKPDAMPDMNLVKFE